MKEIEKTYFISDLFGMVPVKLVRILPDNQCQVMYFKGAHRYAVCSLSELKENKE